MALKDLIVKRRKSRVRRKRHVWTAERKKALKKTRVLQPRCRAARLRNLQIAVCKYVESLGGSAILCEPAEIITFPTDSNFNFRIALRVTGKRPGAMTKAGGV